METHPQLWPLRDIETRFPRLGIKSPTAAYWANRGLQVRGQTVKLNAVRIGSRLHITDDDLRSFLAAINGRPVELLA